LDASRQYSGRLRTGHGWRRRYGSRFALRVYRAVLMSLPGRRQRVLDGIEQALVTDDPGLGLRFAFFAQLTRHEAIPPIEHVPRRLRRFLRRALVPPLLAISVAALVAASWLIPGRGKACPAAGMSAAAPATSPASPAGRCQPDPAIRPGLTRLR
jgi:hypothetical protein